MISKMPKRFNKGHDIEAAVVKKRGGRNGIEGLVEKE